MVIYSCEKCGKTFKQKGHYMKHLQRKTPCDNIKDKIAPFTDLSIIFISATEKLRILKVVEEAFLVYKRIQYRVSTGDLNRYLLDLIEATPPPSVKGKFVKIKYIRV